MTKKGTQGIDQILSKIEKRTFRVGIIGLGYVGLPLAITFHRAEFPVTGFDVDPEKIRLLSRNKSYIKHIDARYIKGMNESGRFMATDDFRKLRTMDAVIICVPTPLNHQREPDLSYVLETTATVARYLKKGQLIVLESTTYPGTTDVEMRDILEERGLSAGSDFYLAYSPEREDPGNETFSTSSIPKVVGGYSKNCLSVAQAVYDTIVIQTVPVSSTRVAEASKLLENIYRSVNIALVNEMKLIFDRMGIDVWEIIDAAKTKPFGFQAFYPGPGLGGHCIPIDPFYLTWKAREYDFHTRFIELAGEINTMMPYYVVDKATQALNDRGLSIKNAKLLILGIAYKKDINDLRESPGLRIIKLLKERKAQVDYHDPFFSNIPRTRRYDFRMKSIELSKNSLGSYDCVLIIADHSVYDFNWIAKHARLIVDTRNAIKKKSKKIIRA